MVLVIDTASSQAFIGLWDGKWLAKNSFEGGRELNSKIILELEKTLRHSQECRNVSDVEFSQMKGIIVNAGPGSFTGLRIGISIANTMAHELDIPIMGVKEPKDVEDLLQKGLSMLKSRGVTFDGVVTPFYGSEPHITEPKPKG